MGQGVKTRVAGRRLGEFDLIEEIGRGGMGIVFRAERRRDGREVAVKILPPSVALDGDAVERFTREAEAAARLSHPGILPILAIGEAEGVHYFATDLVEGPSLDAVVAELRGRDVSQLSRSIAAETTLGVVCPGALRAVGEGEGAFARSCAAIAADVASALGAAHAAHLVHRDVKPGNVLIDRSGQPRLVDFGLSRDETAAGLTRTGDAVGTPAYMAPEQASGRRDVDARADVWGLGVMLYEMLTARLPFQGSHPGRIMRAILDDEVASVRVHNSAVPVALANIVLMCLRKDRDERYHDAQALERDLRAFLAGERVIARPLGAMRRLRGRVRTCARPLVVAVSAASIVVAALLGGGAWWRQSAVRQGQAQLGEAARAVLAGDVAAAEHSYVAAKDLLSADAVTRARVEHLEAALRRDGGEERAAAALRPLLAAIPPSHPRAAALRASLDGTGVVRLSSAPRASMVVTLHPTGSAAGMALPRDGVVPAGAYTVRARVGPSTVLHAPVTVERGSAATVCWPAVPADVTGDVLCAAGPAGPVAVVVLRPEQGLERGAGAREAAARVGAHVLSPGLARLAQATGVVPPGGSSVWLARYLPMPDAASAADHALLEERIAAAAARGEVVVDWTLDADGALRLGGDASAPPSAGLVPEADAFVLRLPLRVQGARPLTRLTLPSGTGVDDVEPTPTRSCWRDGRLVLLFEPAAAAHGFLRLRRDGGFSDASPTGAEAQACLARDAHRLASGGGAGGWCDPAWAGEARRQPTLPVATIRVSDVARAAGAVTVEFTADLEGLGPTLRWPLRGRWRAGEGVAFAPAVRADDGIVRAQGYQHVGLGVRIDGEGRTDRVLRRACTHLVEAQVEIGRIGANGQVAAGVGAVLLATRAQAGESEAAVLARLSDGATVSGALRAASGEERDFLGQGEAAVQAVAREWTIDVGADARMARRERWLSASAGDRWVLLRMFAAGATHRAAEDALREAHTWFAALAAAIRLE